MSTRPEAERALIRAGGAASDEETQRFYAQRVSDYAQVLTAMFTVMYLLGLAVVWVVTPDRVLAIHLHPTKLVHLGVVFACVLVWRLARRHDCPAWLVAASDVSLPVGVALTVAAVSADAPAGLGLFFAPLLVTALVLVLRAALVPSAPLRTALVGLTGALPTVLAARVIASHDPTIAWPVTPNFVMLGSALWCMALIGATTLVSRVIYGLHREVQTAKRLGQYVLGELIGEGGMGAVYRAQHAMLRRPTAVKILLPERAGRESILRFEREVQLTARLTHPNTIAVYDYGRTPDGLFYYAMEYLDGLSLDELVVRYGQQPPGRVIHILLQASGALAEAHGLGLIHRDVKPANMLFCERGGTPDFLKLVDFGLVKNLEPEAGPSLTHTDTITGTPQYLAPESITNPGGIDHRVDIYALGGVAYFLLTGRPPFEGRSVLEVCGHHLHSTPQCPGELVDGPLPEDLEALVMACLAKKPEDRPASALELHEALLECARRTPWVQSEARRFWGEFRATSKRTASPGAAP